MQNPHRPILTSHQMPTQQLPHQQQPLQQQQQQQATPQQQQANLPPPPSQAQPVSAPEYGQINHYPISVPRYHSQSQYAGPSYIHQTPMQIHPMQQFPPPHFQSWQPQHLNHYQPTVSVQQLNQPISTTAPLKPKPKNPARITDPKTKKVVPLTELASQGTQSPTTQSKATNDTNPVNAAKGPQNPTNSTTPSRAVTIKAPTTTATGPTQATTKSDQLTSSTAKSALLAQTAAAQAKPLASIADKTNSVPTEQKDESVSSIKVAPSAAAVVKNTCNKTSSSSASSLAVQNEFAKKVSESLASSENFENKSTVDQDLSKTKGANVANQTKADHKNISSGNDSAKVVNVKDTVVKDETLVVENKENINTKSVTTDQTEVSIVNEDTNEKGDKKGDEVVKDEGKETSSDDSNKENVDEPEANHEGVTLHYEPGQYNPKTKIGKKKYNKEFLMAICDMVISKEPPSAGLDTMNYPAAINDFSPSWQKGPNQGLDARSNDPLRRPNQPYYGGRSSDRQERQKKIIPTSSLGHEVELKTVSNPWKPGSVVKDGVKVDDATADIEKLKKEFRSILNKLTPNNFDSLAEKVTQLQIDTEEKLGDVIDIVFAKALSEPGYSVLYGRMCSHLKKISAGKAENFGTTLLKRCQNQFQADIYSGLDLDGRRARIDAEENADMKKHLNEELYEDMYRCRMRGLGLIKFIGELYKIEMLNDTIMFDCISRLFSDITDESLECLCDLLVTIGKKLDESSKARRDNKEGGKPTQKNRGATQAYQGGAKSLSDIVAQGPAQQQPPPRTLDPTFEKLHKIRKDETNGLSLRIRFKLLDICELREKTNWESRNTKDNNPKKLEEIREAHMEKLESERRQTAMGPRRSQEGRRGLGHSSGSSNQISSLDQGGNRGGGVHMSASSQSICDHPTSDNMKSNEQEAHNKYFHNDKLLVFKNIIKGFSATSSTNPSSSGGLRPASLRKQ